MVPSGACRRAGILHAVWLLWLPTMELNRATQLEKLRIVGAQTNPPNNLKGKGIFVAKPQI